MYADDLIIMSISVSDMQKLLDICATECKFVGMEINSKKSACMRVGCRHNVNVCLLKICGESLTWKQEIQYLGSILNAGKKFTFNTQKMRHKFYRALNDIFGKVG